MQEPSYMIAIPKDQSLIDDPKNFMGNLMTCEFIKVNDMNMDVCINEQDLVGEPAEGRRFKGSIWLQGAVLHPEL